MFTSGFKICVTHGIISLMPCPEYMKPDGYGDAGWLPWMAAIRKWR